MGFSYADFGMTVSTTEEAAVVVQDFIALFFETFTEYKGRPFHISGESYGVRQRPESQFVTTAGWLRDYFSCIYSR